MSVLYRKNHQDKRGKWTDVFRSIFFIVLLYMTFRWLLWEPYVIPSGSMRTSLLEQDYVIVQKFAYGVRLPFSENWLLGPQTPQRGDIVVFKSVDKSGHFLVKRVIGVPGDKIRIDKKGFIQINGEPFVYQERLTEDEDLLGYWEDNGNKRYRVQFARGVEQTPLDIEVPDAHLFMMGDNRNYSHDSRFWGALPIDRIMGKLTMIWLSCRESENFSSFLCNANDLRMERLFKWVDSGD